MNKLLREKQVQIIKCLVEGNSIRATCRMTGAAKGTVLSLLVKVGEQSALYQDKTLGNLKTRLVQCDEIWSFCIQKMLMFPPTNAKNGVLVTFGRGQQLMLIQNL
jgi:hypothetical protein